MSFVLNRLCKSAEEYYKEYGKIVHESKNTSCS